MLGAGAEPAHEQRHHQQGEARAGAGQAIAGPGERGAEREHRRGPQPLGEQRGGDLETGHGAGEQPAQQSELRVAEPELLLPDRQHDVDEIGVTVVQRMRAAGDAGGAALVALDCQVGGRLIDELVAGDAHGAPALDSRSTKALLMKEMTGSPRWLTPVLRHDTTPHPGRLASGRISITSVE